MKTIPLTKGLSALVDDADYDWLMQWKWHAHRLRKGWCAARSEWDKQKGRVITKRMSRELLSLTDPALLADHRNGDTLDNRRENLRPATRIENWMNAPRRGIAYIPQRTSPKKWQVRVGLKGKRYVVGYFTTPEEARAAYLEAAQQRYGDFFRQGQGGES